MRRRSCFLLIVVSLLASWLQSTGALVDCVGTSHTATEWAWDTCCAHERVGDDDDCCAREPGGDAEEPRASREVCPCTDRLVVAPASRPVSGSVTPALTPALAGWTTPVDASRASGWRCSLGGPDATAPPFLERRAFVLRC